MHTISLSADSLYDHLSRLYRETAPDSYVHVDQAGAAIRVVKWTRRSATVEATSDAVAELYDDADYQVEIGRDMRDGAHAARWRRVVEKVRPLRESR